MATTTATITISSTDLLSDELALSTTATLTTAGTSTGLTGTSGLGRKKLASGHAQYTLFDGSDYTADGAHKLYLKNPSTTASWGQREGLEQFSITYPKSFAGDGRPECEQPRTWVHGAGRPNARSKASSKK